MEKNQEQKEREKKTRKEKKRLTEQFQAIDEKKKKLVEGLIERAAFMRVLLEELEEDLNKNGYWEWFSQGDQAPYQRKRPAADLYNQTNKNYQSIIKQLSDLLPKDVPQPMTEDDGFERFVGTRDGLQ